MTGQSAAALWLSDADQCYDADLDPNLDLDLDPDLHLHLHLHLRLRLRLQPRRRHRSGRPSKRPLRADLELTVAMALASWPRRQQLGADSPIGRQLDSVGPVEL